MELRLFESTEVRFIPENESFWVVGKDVLNALEYSGDYNPSRAFDTIPEEWKGMQPIHTLGGIQQMLCLSEQGLYFFLGRSDKPKALPYQKWIAGEVVPSIRKTGEYKVEKVIQKTPHSLEDQILARKAILSICYEGNQLALALDKTLVKLTGCSALREAEVQLIAPQQQPLYTPTEIGKSLNPICSAAKVNKYLENMGWQTRVNKTWEATGDGIKSAIYLDTGKQRSTGVPIRQLKWVADTIFAVQSYINSK